MVFSGFAIATAVAATTLSAIAAANGLGDKTFECEYDFSQHICKCINVHLLAEQKLYINLFR